MIFFLRQIAFNIVFYGGMAIFCVGLMPCMVLPRRQFIVCMNSFFHFVYFIEKHMLNLDFEVRGRENIPAGSQYIVAAKHYSVYETFKLNILFRDTAIIMKKELQYLPLWGWIVTRARMIFVKRGTTKSIQSILEGAKRVKGEGRPLVIFPQGTRVPVDATTAEYPYKRGIARMYEATNLPVLPMATNSGLFWARKAFYKYPGKVVFEFLPVIPAGLTGEDMMKQIESSIETASNRLVAEERAKRAKEKNV